MIKLYNEEQKEAFIHSYTKSEKTIAKVYQIFSWFYPYEAAWGLDLSQQNAKELQPVVDRLTGLRSKSTELILIILREYVKWCGRNGYAVSNGIFEVRINSIEKIQNQMVSSPYHLSLKMKECFADTKEETIDITYRVFLWLAFAGLEDEEAIKVTSDCIDFKNLRINFNGHSYEMYKEGLADFEKACTLTTFLYQHPKYTIRRNRAEGNIITRGFCSPKMDLNTIRPIINKRFAMGDVAEKSVEGVKPRQKSHISYKKIWLSGVFYRAYEQERAGMPVDFSDLVARSIELKEQGKKYTVTKTRTLNTIANTFEKEYLTDYAKWKCAFAK